MWSSSEINFTFPFPLLPFAFDKHFCYPICNQKQGEWNQEKSDEEKKCGNFKQEQEWEWKGPSREEQVGERWFGREIQYQYWKENRKKEVNNSGYPYRLMM